MKIFDATTSDYKPILKRAIEYSIGGGQSLFAAKTNGTTRIMVFDKDRRRLLRLGFALGRFVTIVNQGKDNQYINVPEDMLSKAIESLRQEGNNA